MTTHRPTRNSQSAVHHIASTPASPSADYLSAGRTMRMISKLRIISNAFSLISASARFDSSQSCSWAFGKSVRRKPLDCHRLLPWPGAQSGLYGRRIFLSIVIIETWIGSCSLDLVYANMTKRENFPSILFTINGQGFPKKSTMASLHRT